MTVPVNGCLVAGVVASAFLELLTPGYSNIDQYRLSDDQRPGEVVFWGANTSLYTAATPAAMV